MSKKSPRETTMRGLMLLAILVALCMILSKVDVLIGYAEGAFSSRPLLSSASSVSADINSMQSEYYNLIAGFWEHSSDNLYDRMELKDNGIIWQYTEKTFAFPNNSSKKITRVWTGFLSPTRFGENNYASSNLRVIRETWFMPDTCYGRNFYDIVANTDFSNDTLFFDGIPYTRYNGELADFFPEGALALVDDIRMRPCNKINPLADWLRQNLVYSFDGREIPFDALKFEQEQLLKKYYIPYCLSRIQDVMIFEQTYDLDLKIIISPDGSVENCIVKGKNFITAASKKPIANEVKLWKFPSSGQNSDTVSFKGTFVKKQ